MVMTTRSSTRKRAKITSLEQVITSEQLLEEILLRLPTRSLLKFKLVSKPWLSLISSPHFVLSHTRFIQSKPSLKPQSLLLDVIYRKLPSNFKFLHLNHDTRRLPRFDFIGNGACCVTIIQSCAGLLLCASKSDDNCSSYFICNPVLKKLKMISFPWRPFIHKRYEDFATSVGVDSSMSTRAMDFDQIATVNLAFEPILKASKPVGVNLAFDPLNSPHYKILLIWKRLFVGKNPQSTICYVFPKYSIDIYSSETNSWSIAKIEFSSKLEMTFDRAVFLNGKIHWDSTDRESMYFDVNNESVKKMPFIRMINGKYRYFGQSGGHLHLVFASGHSHLRFGVVEMQKDYSCWFLKYTLNLEAENYTFVPRRQQNSLRDYLMFCAVQSDENDGDSLVILLAGGKAISYNLVYGTVKRLPCSNIDNSCQFDTRTFHASQYIETLYSI